MVVPFLNFNGKCSEAIDFYEKAFNGQNKLIMRYKDAPPNPDFPILDEMKELVLHAEMTMAGTRFSFSDTLSNVIPGNIISLAATFDTVEEVVSIFNQLKIGGEVLMELEPQFYSPMYGWVKDKYGVDWQLLCKKI